MADSRTELIRARTVQEAMLPPSPVIAGIEIASSYRSCDHVGGDFFDFVVVDPGRLGFVMADVSGHGTAAALVMAASKKALQLFGQGCPSPRETILAANDNLLREIPRGMFVSVFYGVLDLATRRFTFVRAGHNPLYLLRRGELQVFKPEGSVLGVMASATLAQRLEEEEIALEPDDAVVIYTDGLTEAVNPSHEMYGDDRLENLLRASAGLSATAVIGALRGDVDTFRAGTPRNDDEALVVLRMLEPPAETPVLGGDEAGATAGNLPPGTAKLIGRDRELTELLGLLGGETKLVTLTGAAGIGKTRAALGAALLAQGAYRAGAWLVDLGEERDIEGICKQTGKALGVDLTRGEPLQRIAHALQGRTRARNGRLLLLLDNCDRCRDAVLEALSVWQQAAPEVVALATCRSMLGAPVEKAYPLRPLEMPRRKQTARIGPVDESTMRSLATTPAVALFVARARERNPGFEITAENADAIGQLCVRLDGLPLALELAAARAKVLTPQQMLQRLSQRFALLRDQRGASRQSTLQGAIGWSWELLTPAERSTLAQLSVCRGGFFLELAEQVVDLSAFPDAPMTMDIVESLHDKSLLESQDYPRLDGERRFWMYESIRAFAQEQLALQGAMEQTVKRWRAALTEYVRNIWKAQDTGLLDQHRLRLQLEAEALAEVSRAGHDDVACWAGLIAGSTLTRQGAVSTSKGLLERVYGMCPPGELRDRAAVVLAMATVYTDPATAENLLRAVSRESPQYAEALIALGHTYQNRGNGLKMHEVMDEVAKLPQHTPRQKAQLHAGRGNACVMTGELDDAMQHYETALAAAEGLGDNMLTGQIIGNLGVIHNMRGDRERAIAEFNRALDLMQSQGHQLAESYWLVNLGVVFLQTGKLPEAERHLKRALMLGRENGLREVESTTLSTLSQIEELRGNMPRALEMAEQAYKMDEDIGNARAQATHLSHLMQLRYKLGMREGFIAGLRKALSLCESVGDRAGTAEHTFQLGDALLREYKQTRDGTSLVEARSLLERARQHFAGIGNPDRVQVVAALSEAALEAGQLPLALELAELTLKQKAATTGEVEAHARARGVKARAGKA